MRASVEIIAMFVAGSVQSFCALILAFRDLQGQRSGWGRYVLTWFGLVCVVYIAYALVYPEAARLLAYLRTWDVATFDRSGQPRGGVHPSFFLAICTLVSSLAMLWTLAACFQYWPGNAYRVVLRAMLLPSAIIGFLAGVWLILGVFVAILLAFVTLLTRLGW